MDTIPVTTPNRKVFSLYELTESISRMFSKHYASPYWIRAEISRLNLYPHSGHCYPDLVERARGKVKSQVKGIIWREDLFAIARKFEDVTREPFREGINIMFLAYVKFSSEYGLSLQIIDIEPLFTLGELAKEKMETIVQLKNEGIFHNNRLLEIPLLPKRLAVISADTSKGYSDLLVTLNGNPYGYRFQVNLFHALLQGDGAIGSILNQLDAIKKNRSAFDVVLIIRGGGDDVGLACYDSYKLSREVATFPLPIISGIGHSTNETVVEMVASVNKITPTDVAHYLLGSFQTFDQRISSSGHLLEMALQVLFDTQNQKFRKISEDFISKSQDYTRDQNLKLNQKVALMRDQVIASVFNHRIALSRYENSLQYNPARLLFKFDDNVTEQTKLLDFHSKLHLQKQTTTIDNFNQKVKILDPVAILKRGFSITRYRGKALQKGFIPEKGEMIETENLTGKFKSIITEN
ncbi:MAG: exodeoxyribonuclease VII large subunit [Lentimicrobium sp.]|nr:exodeoxyribonuclease VII large subunit [Lentimicrobium sp.]